MKRALLLSAISLSYQLMAAEFYQYEHGWCYRGEELNKVKAVLTIVKDRITTQDIRSQAEFLFKTIFDEEYGESTEQSKTSFAWTQACFKRTKYLKQGIQREIGWIEKIQNEAQQKGKNYGIHLVHRPSKWAWLNWLWNRFKEEKQSKGVADKKENKTWEVDKKEF